jgi:hypothetical protein
VTPRYTTTCACGAAWTGALICHCAACHLTFTAIRCFDAHRRGGRCATPDELRARGYSPDERDHWRLPMPPEARDQRF